MESCLYFFENPIILILAVFVMHDKRSSTLLERWAFSVDYLSLPLLNTVLCNSWTFLKRFQIL